MDLPVPAAGRREIDQHTSRGAATEADADIDTAAGGAAVGAATLQEDAADIE